MNYPFFEQYRLYFIGVCKAIIWAVILVLLLFLAYCSIRLLGIAFQKVNDKWFDKNEGIWLIATAAVLMVVGLLWQAFLRVRAIQRMLWDVPRTAVPVVRPTTQSRIEMEPEDQDDEIAG